MKRPTNWLPRFRGRPTPEAPVQQHAPTGQWEQLPSDVADWMGMKPLAAEFVGDKDAELAAAIAGENKGEAVS